MSKRKPLAQAAALVAGQPVTVDAFGGPLEGFVMWRDESLVYSHGHAYRVQVTHDPFKRFDMGRSLIVHQSALEAREVSK